MADESEGGAPSQRVPLFSCNADSTEIITTILKTLQIEKEQNAVCSVTPAGMKFTVEYLKTLQARAYLKCSLFRQFELKEESVEFSVNLSVLVQCLRVFGGASHLELAYFGYGQPLSVLLEEAGVVTQCEVRTLEGTGPVDFNFRSSPILNRAILKASAAPREALTLRQSAFLKEALHDVDLTGATEVTMQFQDESPFLSFLVKARHCQCTVQFPEGDNKDVFTSVECTEPATHMYKLQLLRPCMRALAKAEQTNIRVNRAGMLSLQHVIPTADGATNWVEFLLCAEEDAL